MLIDSWLHVCEMPSKVESKKSKKHSEASDLAKEVGQELKKLSEEMPAEQNKASEDAPAPMERRSSKRKDVVPDVVEEKVPFALGV